MGKILQLFYFNLDGIPIDMFCICNLFLYYLLPFSPTTKNLNLTTFLSEKQFTYKIFDT